MNSFAIDSQIQLPWVRAYARPGYRVILGGEYDKLQFAGNLP